MYGESAVCKYGLVIPDEILEMLVAKLNPEYDSEDYADSPYYYSEDVIEKLGIVRLSGFTGEAFRVTPDAQNEMVYDWEEIMFIPVMREISPFYAAYDNLEDMIEEVAVDISDLLPRDFEYAEYIRHIVGTCTE